MLQLEQSIECVHFIGLEMNSLKSENLIVHF